MSRRKPRAEREDKNSENRDAEHRSSDKKNGSKSILNPITAKTPGQELFIDAIANKEIVICDGPAGSGKAQPLDALVLTPSGYKKMGDFKIGDLVKTPDGKASKIDGIYPQGEVDIYKVSFSDSSSTECCGDHLWLTQTQLDRDAHRPGSVKTTKEILKTLRTKYKNNHSIPMVKPIEFEELLPLPLDPYVLGVMLGDGTLCGPNPLLTTSDEEVVVSVASSSLGASLKKCLGSKYDYRITTKKGAKPKSNLFKEALRNLGLLGKKSSDKFIPEQYKFASVKTRTALLRGLMDTDGTIQNRKTSCGISYTTTSKVLALDVQFLVESLGGKAVISSRITKFTYKNVLKSGKRSYTLHISMPVGINPFQLKRKAVLYVDRTKYKPTRYITSVDLIGKKLAQCISIDHPEHLYITNNFIVTHNTFVAFGLALQYYFNDKNIRRIVIVRPTIAAGDDDDLGYLPGTLNEKMSPFLAPIVKDSAPLLIKSDSFRSNINPNDRGSPDPLTALLAKIDIEVVPLAYMRGRNFHNSFIILDEAQNCTLKDFKLFLTRIGRNSRVIIEGDSTQSDIHDSGFKLVQGKLADMDSIGIVKLDKRDIIRNALIADILDRL